MMPDPNPILDQIHAVREELLRVHDYDLARLAVTLREHERALGDRVVSLPPRRPEVARKAG